MRNYLYENISTAIAMIIISIVIISSGATIGWNFLELQKEKLIATQIKILEKTE